MNDLESLLRLTKISIVAIKALPSLMVALLFKCEHSFVIATTMDKRTLPTLNCKVTLHHMYVRFWNFSAFKASSVFDRFYLLVRTKSLLI